MRTITVLVRCATAVEYDVGAVLVPVPQLIDTLGPSSQNANIV